MLVIPDLHGCDGVPSLSLNIRHHRFSRLLVAHVLEIELKVLFEIGSAELHQNDRPNVLRQFRVGHDLVPREDVLEFEQVLLDVLNLLGRPHREDALQQSSLGCWGSWLIAFHQKAPRLQAAPVLDAGHNVERFALQLGHQDIVEQRIEVLAILTLLVVWEDLQIQVIRL